MPDYNFKVNKEIDLWAATCQIERQLGKAPNGLSKGGELLTIHFDNELEKESIELLNGLIEAPSFGEYPKNAKKMYLGNIWALRDTIEKSLNKTVLAVDFFEKQADGTTSMVVYLSGTEITAKDQTDFKTSINSIIDTVAIIKNEEGIVDK